MPVIMVGGVVVSKTVLPGGGGGRGGGRDEIDQECDIVHTPVASKRHTTGLIRTQVIHKKRWFPCSK